MLIRMQTYEEPDTTLAFDVQEIWLTYLLLSFILHVSSIISNSTEIAMKCQDNILHCSFLSKFEVDFCRLCRSLETIFWVFITSLISWDSFMTNVKEQVERNCCFHKSPPSRISSSIIFMFIEHMFLFMLLFPMVIWWLGCVGTSPRALPTYLARTWAQTLVSVSHRKSGSSGCSIKLCNTSDPQGSYNQVHAAFLLLRTIIIVYDSSICYFLCWSETSGANSRHRCSFSLVTTSSAPCIRMWPMCSQVTLSYLSSPLPCATDTAAGHVSHPEITAPQHGWRSERACAIHLIPTLVLVWPVNLGVPSLCQ